MSLDNHGENGSNQLDDAVKRLEQAEAHLAHLRSEEAKVECEIAEAIEGIEDIKHQKVKVHVVHVNEVEKTSFKEKLVANLQEVWDKSYLELKLPRQPKDIFQTGGEHPKSLMSHLSVSLEQAKEQKIIEDYHFGIASETGGA